MLIVDGSNGKTNEDAVLTLTQTAPDEWMVEIRPGSTTRVQHPSLATILITGLAAAEIKRALANVK